ncbi:hypothetical protein ID866_8866 [Astraeus odoratus]|nr:hypothetical protein ID866_8866 [Astraeus odoratus]
MCLINLSKGFVLLGLVVSTLAQNITNAGAPPNSTKVLILGGGMAGVIAARTLHEQGIDDFVIVDGKIELGGRMINKPFGISGRQTVVEMGPAWIKGTEDGNGNVNPVWALAQKWNLSTVTSDLYGSISFFDYNGPNNYSEAFNQRIDAFDLANAGAAERLRNNQVDMALVAGYNLASSNPQGWQEEASDYYLIDFSPPETSWLASAWKYNFTYVPESGGFSDAHQMCIDQRGFAYIVQAEGAEFLKSNQILFNQTVNYIQYSDSGVLVQTAGGYNLTADYVLVTFSVGVLQHGDIAFEPTLPQWKREAFASMEMAEYTKIFLQFNETFWFPTEMGLYADHQRGKYPVWQNLDHVDFFPGSGIIATTVTGNYARYAEGLNTSVLQDEVMEVLRTMYPNTTIPDPVDIHISTWGSNQLYRGAYPNWGPSFIPAHFDNVRATLDGRLWFAGDATSLKYFGLLQGAYFEGQDAAQQIADCIKGTQCTPNPNGTAVNAQPYPSGLVA